MPFASTASASGPRRKALPRVHSSTTSSGDFLDGAHQQGDTVPLLDGHNASSRSHHASASSEQNRSSDSSNSVIVSPSVRALAALSGSPVPASPRRVEAEASRRTSSIPRSRVRSQSNGFDSQKRFTYPCSTTKTADLIEAFPEPPQAEVRTRNSAPARMSLFPDTTGLEERRSADSQLSPNGHKTENIASTSEYSTLPGVDSARSPSASNAWLSGALPDLPECDGSADTTVTNSRAVRGEDVRYRHSGTPAYDDDVASLREADQNDDRAMATSLDHPGSPVSCKTGATRYFSAASQIGMGARRSVAGTPVPVMSEGHVQDRNESRVQQERAVADGALRFVSQMLGGTGSNQAVREEVIVPVSTTSHGRACLHKKGFSRAKRSNQDGFGGTEATGEKQSRSDRYCLFCRANRIAHRVSELVGSNGAKTSLGKAKSSS